MNFLLALSSSAVVEAADELFYIVDRVMVAVLPVRRRNQTGNFHQKIKKNLKNIVFMIYYPLVF